MSSLKKFKIKLVIFHTLLNMYIPRSCDKFYLTVELQKSRGLVYIPFFYKVSPFQVNSLYKEFYISSAYFFFFLAPQTDFVFFFDIRFPAFLLFIFNLHSSSIKQSSKFYSSGSNTYWVLNIDHLRALFREHFILLTSQYEQTLLVSLHIKYFHWRNKI